MARTGIDVPLLVSHRSMLERAGPLGRAWSTPDGSESVSYFHGRWQSTWESRLPALAECH